MQQLLEENKKYSKKKLKIKKNNSSEAKVKPI